MNFDIATTFNGFGPRQLARYGYSVQVALVGEIWGNTGKAPVLTVFGVCIRHIGCCSPGGRTHWQGDVMPRGSPECRDLLEIYESFTILLVLMAFMRSWNGDGWGEDLKKDY